MYAILLNRDFILQKNIDNMGTLQTKFAIKNCKRFTYRVSEFLEIVEIPFLKIVKIWKSYFWKSKFCYAKFSLFFYTHFHYKNVVIIVFLFFCDVSVLSPLDEGFPLSLLYYKQKSISGEKFFKAEQHH